MSGTVQIAEHLSVTEDIGEHVCIDRFVADQVDCASHQAAPLIRLGPASTSRSSHRSRARSSDLVERQEGQSTGAATFQQINRASRDAVIVHHHLSHPCAGSHFKGQAMAFINFTKLRNMAMNSFQARFEQQPQCASAPAFLKGFPTAVVAGNVALEPCLFLLESGTGALLDRDRLQQLLKLLSAAANRLQQRLPLLLELLQQGLDPLIFRPVLISVLFQLQLSFFVLPEPFQQLLAFLLKRCDATLKLLALAGALLLLFEPGA